MKPGRKPAPTALKILAGTRPCRVAKNEPTPAVGTPDPPCELSPTASKEWDRITPILERMRILTEADGAALAVYCETFAEWVSTGAKVRKDGMLCATAAGGLKASPLVAIHQRARADMLRTLGEFGLSPSTRASISAAAAPEVDALTQLLKDRKGKPS